MTAIAATADQASTPTYRPSLLDEVDPAGEGHHGAQAIDGNLSFDDLVDVLNPLQHLPVVSTIYRAITGDQIQPHARAIGAGIYGGPVGFMAAGAAMAVEEAVGTTADKQLANLFKAPEPEEKALATATAPVTPTVPTPAAATSNPVAQSPATAASVEPTSGEPTTQMFAIKDMPKMFALPSSAERTLPLAGRSAAPTPAAETLLNAQAAGASTESAPIASAPALSAAQGDLLDRFINGANAPAASAARTGASAAAPAPQTPGLPADMSPEWFAAQMHANLQKYADAQRAGS